MSPPVLPRRSHTDRTGLVCVSIRADIFDLIAFFASRDDVAAATFWSATGNGGFGTIEP